MEKRLLRYLLFKALRLKAFSCSKALILELLQGSGLPNIGMALLALDELRPNDDLTVAELHDFYMSHYGSVLSEAAKGNIERLFKEIENEGTVSLEVAESVLLTCLKRELGRQIADNGLQLIEGREEAFSDLLRLVDDYPKLSVNGVENLTPVTSDLTQLLSELKAIMKWQFNIESIRQPLGGLGPGAFIEIAARPETGKTAFCISLALAPGGFCWQGANVLGLYNEEKAEKVMLRAFNAATQMTTADIIHNVDAAKEKWNIIKDRFTAYDVVGFNLTDIPALVKKHKADIVIIDQLDKIRIDGDFNRTDEKLRELYTGGRELAKRENTCVIGISQLSADAHNKLYPDFSMLEGSKTGKAAEADLILCIGSNETFGNTRGLNICKNKITGTHSMVNINLNPLLSTYTV